VTTKTQLEVGETGFVTRNQLWLSEKSDVERLRLYVEPQFQSRSQATPGMLRMTAVASNAHPGESYYGIYLPKRDLFSRPTQIVTGQQARERGLVAVKRVFIISSAPGKQPFATIPDFYFGQVN